VRLNLAGNLQLVKELHLFNNRKLIELEKVAIENALPLEAANAFTYFQFCINLFLPLSL